MRSTEEELYILKEVEFYAASTNAWFTTRFEHDKSLLGLSAGAIGILITLVSTVGVKSIESLIIYILALLSFMICLGSLLMIFRKNSEHLEQSNRAQTIHDPMLSALDKTAITSFMIGILLASIIGISTAITSYTEKGNTVTDNKIKSVQTEAVLEKSLNGAFAMSPKEQATSSVTGINNMRPAAPTPAAAPSPNKEDAGKK
jgi:uncharacterized membrane protein YuzA (DUF378 family)